MMQLNKREINTLCNRKKKVAKLSDDINAYFETTDDMSLPDIECTVVGYSEMGAIETHDLKDNKGNVYGFKAKVDGNEYDVKYIEEDDDIYFVGWEELEEEIRYQRRRLNKAWRIFKSENPDAELERDDEED